MESLLEALIFLIHSINKENLKNCLLNDIVYLIYLIAIINYLIVIINHCMFLSFTIYHEEWWVIFYCKFVVLDVDYLSFLIKFFYFCSALDIYLDKSFNLLFKNYTSFGSWTWADHLAVLGSNVKTVSALIRRVTYFIGY